MLRRGVHVARTLPDPSPQTGGPAAGGRGSAMTLPQEQGAGTPKGGGTECRRPPGHQSQFAEANSRSLPTVTGEPPTVAVTVSDAEPPGVEVWSARALRRGGGVQTDAAGPGARSRPGLSAQRQVAAANATSCSWTTVSPATVADASTVTLPASTDASRVLKAYDAVLPAPSAAVVFVP
jgi:hypothetical protein